ncbi:nitroreductase [Amycolatopsis sp. lyj-84]|uniref:nitroreductase n=1 Tax=Amycolatopsis sp. lyj-84 TaxID=2789284 RepID=UPI00397D70D7
MKQPDDPPSGEWTATEVEVLARAAVSAPSVRNSQPWSLALPGRRAELSEWEDVHGSDSGYDGRDRLISCGAALANLAVAMRVLGWNARVSLAVEDRAPLVAVVMAGRRFPPSGADLHGYSAISRRRGHGTAFSRTPVAPALLDRIVGRVPGDVLCRVVAPGELRPLAVALEAAGSVQGTARRADWTSAWTAGGFADRPAPPGQDPPPVWPGVTRETLLIIGADSDRRTAQVSIGRAMELAWLTGIESGIAASALTRPLRVPSVRDRLISELALPGFPGVIMRLGYPAG